MNSLFRNSTLETVFCPFPIYFFSVREGGGGVRGAGGVGGSVWYFKSRERGVFREGEGLGGHLRRIGQLFGGEGGGLNIFFRGRNVQQDKMRER